MSLKFKSKTPLLRTQKESEIQRGIMEYLEWKKWLVIKINNVGIMKPNGQFIPPRQKGLCDLICLKDGLFLGIEVKRPGNRPTEVQAAFLKEVEGHGGIAIVASSIDDLKNYKYV